MRWCTGWVGRSHPGVRPPAGREVPGWDAVWSVGWPAERVGYARAGDTALTVVGECGADDVRLATGLHHVRAGRWRELTGWPGSYLVVAAHGPLTVVIGDLTGQHPVYWRQAESGVWWASAASALAALDAAPVDPVALTASLALGRPDVLAGRSLFRDVHRVPPGCLLLIDAGVPTVERFEPVEYEPVPLTEAAPVVGAALRLAVASRLDGRRPVSSDLAGLDSTTLACLAAEHGQVTATTFTDPRIRDDDLVYARRTVAAVPGLRHRIVTGNEGTIYYSGLDDLGHLPTTDAPNPYAVTTAIKRTVMAAATDRGPGLHFTGTGGDTVLSATGYLPDLLRDHAYRAAFTHAQARARIGHTSVWKVLRRARPASRITLPDSLRLTAAELRRPPRPWDPSHRPPHTFTPLLATAGWMTPQARRLLADALDQAADGTAAPRRLAAWTDRQDLLRLGADMNGWRAIAEGEFGTELAAPYLDNEVIRTCLAVPPEQRGAPEVFKPLLTAAFPNGPVPVFVLHRVTKGGFNGVSYAGLREHAPTIGTLLGPGSRLAALGLVGSGTVSAVLRRAAAGQHVPQGSVHLAVAAEVWLRQLDARPTAWWEKVSGRVATA
ncbi:albusnodin/ikarugamycin family macrolactam cyclase [Streptomyces alkaliphilus]|uniref:albusnodin/ikarugamycin family macrolactam cyclase n=1 Tax=Streptomyces alkaliphilus TaxID=1472722 RepID=UPI00117D5A1F|nr:albusnodin/ikarugamycin family macrolactam cyclase [Streptomyces alkaliphilus]